MSNARDFVIENGVLTKYLGKDKDVNIPEGVTVIGDGAFRRKGVERVTMPDAVTEIGWDAFSSCTDLAEVTFSRNLKVISPNAFSNCQKLTGVVLYNGLEKIGGCAFSTCIGLKKLILPDHPVDIDDHAFQNCDSLADEDGFVIVKGVLSLYNGKTPEKIHVPDGVKHIIRGAFRNQCYVRSLVLPASVEHIDEGVFQEIHNLNQCMIGFSVADPKEAQRLIKKVFCWEALAWVYLKDGLNACDLILEALKNQIASKSGREELMRGLLSNENTAPLTRFLNCVKKLPLNELDAAIEDAKHTSVRAVLQEYKHKKYSAKKVAMTKQAAEDKAIGAKEKTLADWRKELKISKKGDCYVVTGFKDDIASDAALYHKEYSGIVTIPGRIGGIHVDMGERVFQNCPYVKTVIIEEGVSKIGAFCFSGCHKLRDVYVPASVTDFGWCDCAFYIEPNQTPFTVHAPAGSKAEEKVKENNILFVAE